MWCTCVHCTAASTGHRYRESVASTGPVSEEREEREGGES